MCEDFAPNFGDKRTDWGFLTNKMTIVPPPLIEDKTDGPPF
jgi:hypothetical protein